MVTSIGFRCWADKFSFVVLGGDSVTPTVLAHGQTKFPHGQEGGRLFAWLRAEAQSLLDQHRPDVGYIKVAERSPRAPDPTRLQAEAIFQEAGYSGTVCLELAGRNKTQIKRDTNFPRAARYVESRVGEAGLAALDNDRYREACLAALCGLPEG